MLVIDIGNSSVKAGLFDKKNKLTFAVSYPINSKSLSNKLLTELKSIAGRSSIIQAGISSVVPHTDNYWRKAVKDYFNIRPVFISAGINLPIKIKVDNPFKLGSDRICNAAASYEIFNRRENAIVIDFGTATTYDVVLKNGDYLGGIIAPGIITSAHTLKFKTSKLPKLILKDFTFPKNLIGRNTIRAMQSGVMYSALYSMEGIIREIQISTGKKFNIILTGGLAKFIRRKTKYKTVYIENLVLHGINYILKQLPSNNLKHI